MPGTANEQQVFQSLNGKPLIHSMFECGMLSIKLRPWPACSPDRIAFIKPREVGIPSNQLALASVEIKTSLAALSLDRSLRNSMCPVCKCVAGDPVFVEKIPKQHAGKIIQQATVLNVC